MAFAQAFLVGRAAGGKTVREIAAGKALAMYAVAFRGVDASQVVGTRVAAAFTQAFGDFDEDGVQHSHVRTPEASGDAPVSASIHR